MRVSLGLAALASAALAACGVDPASTPPPYVEGPPASPGPIVPRAPVELAPPAPAADPPAADPPAADPPADDPPPDDPPADDPPPDPTAGCAQVRVVNTAGATLNVRPDASTAGAPVGALAAGQVVDTVDVVDGEDVDGVTTWYEIDDGAGLGGFVSGAFAACVDRSAPPPAGGILLPLQCGTTATVTQGNNTTFSHNGKGAFAFDFGLARHTPLVAVAAGTVIAANGSVHEGDPCWSGGGQECANTVNYVLVQHDDGTASLYMHLDAPSVSVGDVVARGQQVGLSGGTGWSTGPHAHVQRQELCGSWWCQSVETRFADVDGGVPQTGDVVTSQNCP